MNRMHGLLLMGAVLIACTASAGAAKAPKSEVLGTWHGKSICTRIPGNEACNDETVLYEFTDLPKQPDAVHQKASKLVNGKFELMGEMDFRFQPARKRWESEFKNTRTHILWWYVVNGRQMIGKCERLPSHQIGRNAELTRG